MRELRRAQPPINTHPELFLDIISQWTAISSLLSPDQLLRFPLTTQLAIAKGPMTAGHPNSAAIYTRLRI